MELPAHEQAVVASREPKRPLWKRILWGTGAGLLWILAVIGAVLVGVALWIRRTFGPISVDQMLMNMAGGGEGAPSGYVTTLVLQALILPLASVMLLVGGFYFVRWKLRSAAAKPRKHGEVSKPRKSSRVISALIPVLFSVVTFLTGFAVFAQAVDLPQYVRSILSPYDLEDYYAVPSLDGEKLAASTLVDGTAPQKNLVVIVLESGEESYSNEDLFGINMNEPLEMATSDWQRFDSLSRVC